MKNNFYMACLILGLSLLGTAAPILAQEVPPTGQPQAEAVPPAAAQAAGFEQAAGSLQQRLETSLQELQALRTQSAQEMIPLSRQLGELENELTKARQEFQQTTRVLDSRTLDLTNLRNEIKSRSDEVGYLTSLLTEYIRNFESRLHIAELQRYRDVLREAGLASENTQLSGMEVFK
ncbi:MAG: hypothetical protein HC898_00395, partial [Phycisphaerales bacterium]|nr:hypothetical protein [Phycisphaerales bacterium]